MCNKCILSSLTHKNDLSLWMGSGQTQSRHIFSKICTFKVDGSSQFYIFDSSKWNIWKYFFKVFKHLRPSEKNRSIKSVIVLTSISLLWNWLFQMIHYLECKCCVYACKLNNLLDFIQISKECWLHTAVAMSCLQWWRLRMNWSVDSLVDSTFFQYLINNNSIK